MPGLAGNVLETIDFDTVIRRIQLDVRSDFIISPHYNIIFVRCITDLGGTVRELLRSGRYEPELPLTMDVPKGRGFTRPGSILHPIDRVVYQALADLSALALEEHLDRSRSFAQIVTDVTSTEHLFSQSQESWEGHQRKLADICDEDGYIVKADVANYFERIPQHHLINLMGSTECMPEVVRLMEQLLLSFQQMNSFGIIQGVFPSDLLGNFYLSHLDAFCELHDIPSSRYVDDIYMQFGTEKQAYEGLMQLISRLRADGLHLNEYKSGVRTAEDLLWEETELDRIFAETRESLEDEVVSESGYGFYVEWELEEMEEVDVEGAPEEDLHVASVIRLYGLVDDYVTQSGKIEKFCLPVLRTTGSDIAVERSLRGIIDRPDMSKLYLSYLSKFVPDSAHLTSQLERLLDSNELISDHQRIYILGALMNCREAQRRTVNTTLTILNNGAYAQELRAIAAIFAAKHGGPQQRRSVRTAYESESSSYVRAAILHASRYFPFGNERSACRKAWGGHSLVNSLISRAITQ